MLLNVSITISVHNRSEIYLFVIQLRIIIRMQFIIFSETNSNQNRKSSESPFNPRKAMSRERSGEGRIE